LVIGNYISKSSFVRTLVCFTALRIVDWKTAPTWNKMLAVLKAKTGKKLDLNFSR